MSGRPDPAWRRYLRFWGANPGEDIAEEVQFHLETEIEDLVSRGLSPAEARRAALAQFGDVDRAMTECGNADRRRLRRDRWAHWRDVLTQECRYILRGFAHRPGFSAAVVGTLALGIGANAAVFSTVDQVFLRPPAGVAMAPELRRLYLVREAGDRRAYVSSRFGLPGARAVVDGLAPAYPATIYGAGDRVRLDFGAGGARVVNAAWVMPNFFTVLGVRVIAGRDLAGADLQFGQPASSLIISWALWERAFDRSPDVIGRTVRIGGHPMTIVGVAPQGFAGIDVDAADVWLPLSGARTTLPGQDPWYESWGTRVWSLVARVPPGESEEQLVVRMRESHRAGLLAFLAAHPRSRLGADTVSRAVAGSIVAARGPSTLTPALKIAAMLAGVAALVLLIAVANVGNLLLGRAMQRRREVAVRVALGMSRARLAGHLLLESALVGVVASVAATLAAVWVAGALRAFLFPGVTWAGGAVDGRIATFAAAVGMAAGLAAGILPAIHLARIDMGSAIKSGGRAALVDPSLTLRSD